MFVSYIPFSASSDSNQTLSHNSWSPVQSLDLLDACPKQWSTEPTLVSFRRHCYQRWLTRLVPAKYQPSIFPLNFSPAVYSANIALSDSEIESTNWITLQQRKVRKRSEHRGLARGGARPLCVYFLSNALTALLTGVYRHATCTLNCYRQSKSALVLCKLSYIFYGQSSLAIEYF